MKNRVVGFIILGFAGIIALVTFLFNQALTSIVSASCTHGSSCPMWATIGFETNLSLAIVAVIAMIGLFFIFWKGEVPAAINIIKPQVEVKELKEENFADVLAKMDEGEKTVFRKVIESKGTIFQSDLVEKTSFTKVKVSRVLDKLEGRGVIERKRRGMTNVVIIKH
ncbi:MAG: hypothetical protein V1839_00650 [archaeon]